MSFQNYDNFQAQQGQSDAGGAGQGVPQQDTQMGGQNPEGQQAQFQGGNVGEPGSAGGQPGGDAKTTLWWVLSSIGAFRQILHLRPDSTFALPDATDLSIVTYQY